MNDPNLTERLFAMRSGLMLITLACARSLRGCMLRFKNHYRKFEDNDAFVPRNLKASTMDLAPQDNLCQNPPRFNSL